MKYYVYHEQPGELLDFEDVIKTWEATSGPSTDVGKLPKTVSEDKLHESQESAEGPLDKKGPVGDWCRTHSITELVIGKDGEEASWPMSTSRSSGPTV
ncbi:MAG: hypothetical protein COB16_04840 [Rhodobacteraceae bacterium]|nr:MAG: hypothetical protein COB16_04840 [Paracoccaceae bacterium]